MGPSRRPSKPKRSSKATDEPQPSQTKPESNGKSKIKTISKSPISSAKTTPKNDDDDADGRLYCICRKKYRPEDVMICCDNCEGLILSHTLIKLC